MALTPETFNEELDEVTDVIITDSQPEPSRTWRLDFESGRIGGFIDGDEAIRQYIRKAIQTARNRYLIYDGDYGSELEDLLGRSVTPDLLDVELPRLVRESIEYDDRIASVTNIEVERIKDALYVSVTVETVLGEELTEEVTL